VAQQRVVGHAAVERALERVDVVNALPNVAAFAKEVLIHVRHGGRIGIEADVPENTSENVDADALTASMATRG
jgi:hypothetical protein